MAATRRAIRIEAGENPATKARTMQYQSVLCEAIPNGQVKLSGVASDTVDLADYPDQADVVQWDELGQKIVEWFRKRAQA
jgi:hypothetical protein